MHVINNYVLIMPKFYINSESYLKSKRTGWILSPLVLSLAQLYASRPAFSSNALVHGGFMILSVTSSSPHLYYINPNKKKTIDLAIFILKVLNQVYIVKNYIDLYNKQFSNRCCFINQKRKEAF